MIRGSKVRIKPEALLLYEQYPVYRDTICTIANVIDNTMLLLEAPLPPPHKYDLNTIQFYALTKTTEEA